jgi:hypothetical protein
MTDRANTVGVGLVFARPWQLSVAPSSKQHFRGVFTMTVLDLIGRPRPLISGSLARGRAREGKCWRFYASADPLQAALRLAPLIIPMV